MPASDLINIRISKHVGLADLPFGTMLSLHRSGWWFAAVVLGNKNAIDYCRKSKIALTRAQGEGVDSVGGVLVPDELENIVISLRESYGVLRREANVVTMHSDSKRVPRRTAGLTSYYSGANLQLVESQISWDSVGLTAKKLTALLRTSNELSEDSAPDLAADIANDLASTFAYQEDLAGLTGDGTSTYGGMFGVTNKILGLAGAIAAAAGHNSFGTIDATDLGKLIAALPARAMPNAKWFVSTTGYGAAFVRIAGATGGLTTAIGANGQLQANFMGWPVVFTNVLPQTQASQAGKVLLLFGDMKKAVAMGSKRGISLARSALGTTFELDQTRFRGTERFDAVVHDIGDASNAGAVAALIATA